MIKIHRNMLMYPSKAKRIRRNRKISLYRFVMQTPNSCINFERNRSAIHTPR